MLPSSIYGQLSDPLMQAAAAALASAGTDSLIGSRDTMFTKIFVGGLPYHTSDKTLHEYFEQFGDIEEAVVITDRQTQKSRGYGFVTMKDRAAAERACKDPNPIIDGRKANVNLAYLGAKPRTNVQLAALANHVQLPLQTQLQALFPTRIGLPQLYYPSAGLINPLLGAAAAQSQGAVDYTALAAAVANGQSAAAAYTIPQTGSRFPAAVQAAQAASLDPYGYAVAAGYGIVPGTYPLQSAATQQQLEHQRV
ncbi:hypothetical protein KIN20_019130 [Parelaphostrongylus tenuis]|uniref:RRM domain-containing protein n=1 Tax=Parelaphostrongylus tenuis TaxID=148309 RepID=A0AAD5QS35_PARTN|nr:hypothetical protein KIN20_019130 [Parelaphostrongylus tenuis]